MRSRISAAAFSVKVTATIRSGSTPSASSSRYTSTSFRVFPVPALARTTVLVVKFIIRLDLCAFNLHRSGKDADSRTTHNPDQEQGQGLAAQIVPFRVVVRFFPQLCQRLNRQLHEKQLAYSATSTTSSGLRS